jgi:penicillin-binding protein 1C
MSGGRDKRQLQRRTRYTSHPVTRAAVFAAFHRRHTKHGVPFLRLALGLVLALLLGTLVTTGVAAGAAFAGWHYLTDDLPSPEQFEALQFQTTKIYDRNWRLIAEISDPNLGRRTVITYQELMDHIAQQQNDPTKPHHAWIIDATIAAEDATFWTNPGVDPRAILRSFFSNIAGDATSGASTITQQLVRLLYPERIGNERTYTRKLREAIMAVRFTQHYTKQQILELYLNNVYYGNLSYGIDAASQTYFNKFAWELDLAEASMLAGLPQAPSLYDPTQNYDLAKARQRYVLNRMVQLGMITRAEADAAYAEPLFPQRAKGQYIEAPHFVNFVLEQLSEKYGRDATYRGGLMVRTTLDLDIQHMAEQVVAQRVKQLAPYHVNNGALVAILPWSGEIIAMVGSADFYNTAIDGQVNVTTQERQPGSAIKPITYLTAFEKLGWYPGTILFDYEKTWKLPSGPYTPHNYTNLHYGAVTIREALANSLNIPAVQAIDQVGVPTMIEMAHKVGIRTGFWRNPSFYGLAITLGGGEVKPLELTNAFATIANNGRYVPYTPFLEIIAPGNQKVYELNRAQALAHGEQVVRPESAYMITSILSDNNARALVFGLRNPLVLPELGNRPVAAKTGTSEDARDLWTVGYTTDVVVGVWVGNTDNSPTRGLDGVSSAALIWHDFMVKVHQDPQLFKVLAGPDGKPIAPDFVRPSGIIEAPVCAATGKRPIPGVRTVLEVMPKNGGPRLRCDQVNAWEAQELRAALATPKSMTAQGRSRVLAYAAMVGRGGPIIDTERQPTATPQVSLPLPPASPPPSSVTPTTSPATPAASPPPSPTASPGAPPPKP